MIRNDRCRLLTPEEERDLGIRSHQGDLAARDDLVLANVGLVAKICGEIRRPDDDLHQAGLLGLIRAAARFDPLAHPGRRFSDFASRWIRHQLRREFRGRPLVSAGESFDPPDPTGPAEVLEAREEAAAVLLALTPIQRFVIVRRFGLDGEPRRTHLAIGKLLGYAHGRVREIEAEAMDLMRAARCAPEKNPSPAARPA